MKKMILGAGFLMIGCSHVPAPSTVSVALPFSEELVVAMQKASADRSPASLALDGQEEKSPRRIYFSALYHQYLSMAQHLGQESEINSCPQYHHDKIETDALSKPQLAVQQKGQVEKEGKPYFPEFAFSRKFSLEDYHQNLKNEIATLCEEGVSDDFYKFDNLITHHAGKKSFHRRPDSMKSMLKIPVFANYYLLKMLQPQLSVGHVHPEEKRIIEVTQAHWFEKYVAEAHRMRNNFIKNKMVKR